MGKAKSSSSKSSKRPKHSYHNVTQVLSDGKAVFKAEVHDGEQVVQLGVFARAPDAAAAADLASLALCCKGPLNRLKNNYLQRDVEKEPERLKQLGVQIQGSSKRGKPSQQQQQSGAADSAPEQELQQPAKRGSRKRKADSPPQDVTAAAAECARDQAGQAKPKRLKVKHTVKQGDSGSKQQASPVKARSRPQPSPPAEAPGAVGTALALPRAGILPTAAAVQYSTQGGGPDPVMAMGQLRSALAAHDLAMRQLRAAQEALEASGGQLAAVAQAMGLQGLPAP